jgi:hypothetical protein
MADLENKLNDLDDWSEELDFSKDPGSNKRIAVRYVREDIAASVCKISLYIFGFRFTKDILVELIDISSKGVLIATNKKLKVNKKIILTLTFEDSKTFKINAKIVRKSVGQENQYGIKFDRFNNDLGEYLLKTQRKLVFR